MLWVCFSNHFSTNRHWHVQEFKCWRSPALPQVFFCFRRSPWWNENIFLTRLPNNYLTILEILLLEMVMLLCKEEAFKQKSYFTNKNKTKPCTLEVICSSDFPTWVLPELNTQRTSSLSALFLTKGSTCVEINAQCIFLEQVVVSHTFSGWNWPAAFAAFLYLLSVAGYKRVTA